MSVAAGPLGRNVEGTGSLSSKGKVSAMYSYSRTKGLFGGASLEGSVIVERSDANAKAYGTMATCSGIRIQCQLTSCSPPGLQIISTGANVTAKQLLSGQVDVPSFAEVLIDTISRKCGSSAEWKAQVEEDEDGFRPDPSRGYSFTSSFASGGSNAPTPEKKGKLGGLGSIGRSRSSSGVGGGGPSENGYGDLRDDSNRDPFAGGVESGHSSGPRFDTSSTPRFEHHFTSDVPSSQDDYTWSSATGAAIGKTSKSAKLTKSRSSHGMSRGNSRDLLDFGSSGGGSDDKQPQWSAEAAPADPRDSFDSLDADTGSRYTGYSGYTGYGDDDDDADRRYDDTSSRRDGARRFRSSTVTSNSSTSRPSLFARARSASSPWASFRGSSSSKKNSRSASPAAAPYDDHGLSTVPSYDSYDEPTRDYTSRSAADSKPWDSEDEDLNRPKPTVPSSSRNNAAFDSPSNIRTTARGDPFDFSQVEADFQTATSGPRLRGAGGGSGPARDIVNPFAPASKPTPSRSRSSTTGGGICQALALFDFPGVEVSFTSSKTRGGFVFSFGFGESHGAKGCSYCSCLYH